MSDKVSVNTYNMPLKLMMDYSKLVTVYSKVDDIFFMFIKTL